jgi:8-oxo-dGTP diphosphatase
MKTIEVVAAVIQDGSDVFCAQRGKHQLPYIHLKWEFPGGKIEAGEDHKSALVREIQEELNVQIKVIEPLRKVDYQYPDFRLIMHPYRCVFARDEKRERVTLTEHQSAVWLPPSSVQFLELDWAEADVPIVKEIIRQRS